MGIADADQSRMGIVRIGVKHFQAGLADYLGLLGQHIGLFKDLMTIRAFHPAGG